jgi:hypothetical protein
MPSPAKEFLPISQRKRFSSSLWSKASCGFIATGGSARSLCPNTSNLVNCFAGKIEAETLQFFGVGHMPRIKWSLLARNPTVFCAGAAASFAHKNKGGHIMASNFKILMHQSGESLNLKLSGDFDGTSAFELLDVLKEKGHGVQRVIIDTKNLSKVHPFGQGILEKRLSELGSDWQKLLFTGDKADLISP